MRMRQLWSDESGANLVEYAMLIAFIAVACVGSIFPGIKDAVGQIFTNASVPLSAAS